MWRLTASAFIVGDQILYKKAHTIDYAVDFFQFLFAKPPIWCIAPTWTSSCWDITEISMKQQYYTEGKPW